MKKWMLSSFLLMSITILGACGSDGGTASESESKEEDVFTEEDIEKAEEMMEFLEMKMEEFESTANTSIENGDIKVGDNDRLIEEVQNLGQEIVVQPFLDKYPNSMIPRNESENFIPITIETDSSESCALGNCTYEEIKVLGLNYDFKDHQEYHSDTFGITQLIVENIETVSKISEEREETEIRFVKTEGNDLVITSIPHLQVQTLYLDEYDQEFESIKTSVPESEVEAEQAEYKEEVEEALSKFPELQ